MCNNTCFENNGLCNTCLGGNLWLYIALIAIVIALFN